jgi:hypothetical protein
MSSRSGLSLHIPTPPARPGEHAPLDGLSIPVAGVVRGPAVELKFCHHLSIAILVS